MQSLCFNIEVWDKSSQVLELYMEFKATKMCSFHPLFVWVMLTKKAVKFFDVCLPALTQWDHFWAGLKNTKVRFIEYLQTWCELNLYKWGDQMQSSGLHVHVCKTAESEIWRSFKLPCQLPANSWPLVSRTEEVIYTFLYYTTINMYLSIHRKHELL